MEKWTLSDISAAVLFLVALISGVGYLLNKLKAWIEKLLDEKFKALGSQISELETKLDKVDIETCKNFLVRFLADIEREDYMTEVEKQRFWEEYGHYIGSGGNSYIKEWTDRLRKEGKL